MRNINIGMVTSYETSKNIAAYNFNKESEYFWYCKPNGDLGLAEVNEDIKYIDIKSGSNMWCYAYDEHTLKNIFKAMAISKNISEGLPLPELKYEQRIVFSGACVVSVSFYYTDMRFSARHDNPAEAHGLLLVQLFEKGLIKL